MKAMRCLLKGFSLDTLLKIMHFLVFLHLAFIKNSAKKCGFPRYVLQSYEMFYKDLYLVT